MPYCQLFYHLVWTTYRRRPLLTAEVEPLIYRYLLHKALALEGVVYALNGVADHVHMVVSIPPKVAVAKFTGQVKAVASTRFNKEHPEFERFGWQDAYGAFTFDAKRLPNVVAYVERQKEHHAQGTLISVLERDEGPSPMPAVREARRGYAMDQDAWFEEMLAEGDG
jgi:REP element-mobilizing transposase RayT